MQHEFYYIEGPANAAAVTPSNADASTSTLDFVGQQSIPGRVPVNLALGVATK